MTCVDLGVAFRPYGDSLECGDVHVAWPRPNGVVLALIDGLGHGHEAAIAAQRAAREIVRFCTDDVPTLLRRCHEAIRPTRGAVLTLATVDAASSALTWAGIGNVDALLLRRNATRETLVTPGGVVGSKLPTLRPSVVPVGYGDVLVLASDGIRSSFRDDIAVHEEPQTLADSILRAHARPNDDASVLVARYTGENPPFRVLPIRESSDVVMARKATREVGALVGMQDRAVESLAAAVTEVGSNIVVHAGSGEIHIGVAPGERRAMVVAAHDAGPGIADVDRALEDHFSTTNTLGLGLPAAKRQVDELAIASEVGKGTSVILKKWIA